MRWRPDNYPTIGLGLDDDFFIPLRILNAHGNVTFVTHLTPASRRFTPFCVENAQMVMFPSLIYARNTGVLNEKRCKCVKV